MVTEILTVPPHDLRVERAVLAALLIDSEAFAYCRVNLSAKHFYKTAHQLIFKAAIALSEEKMSCDLLTLTAKLSEMKVLKKVGGATYLSEVILEIASSADVESHIKILKNKFAARQAVAEATSLISRISEGENVPSLLEESTEAFQAILKSASKRYSKGDGKSVLDYYSNIRITADTDVPPIEPIVKIGEAVICTPENITTISGESKASKSALANVIIAGSICRNDLDAESFKFLTVKPNTSHKAVLHFDTEQSRTIHKARHEGILARAGLKGKEPENYFSYNIRKLDIDAYADVTSDLCAAANELCGGIHLIVIDGIADYIKSVNDEEMSNDIVHYFEQLSIEFSCPIICIIHLNPGSESKQRGHLGSQLQRKSESILVIKKDKKTGVSICEPQFLRNAGNLDVPRISFKYDPDKKYHVYAGEYVDETKTEEELLENWVNSIFAMGGEIGRSVIVKEICELSGCKLRTAEEKIRKMEKMRLIKRVNPKSKSALFVKS